MIGKVSYAGEWRVLASFANGWRIHSVVDDIFADIQSPEAAFLHFLKIVFAEYHLPANPRLFHEAGTARGVSRR